MPQDSPARHEEFGPSLHSSVGTSVWSLGLTLVCPSPKQGRSGFLLDLVLGMLTMYAIAMYIASTYDEVSLTQLEREHG